MDLGISDRPRDGHFIYNKNLLIGSPPAGLAQLLSISQEMKTRNPGVIPILWDYKSAYYSWGILASAGAYVFAKAGSDAAFCLKRTSEPKPFFGSDAFAKGSFPQNRWLAPRLGRRL
jgi:maltose-binding protein MalE